MNTPKTPDNKTIAILSGFYKSCDKNQFKPTDEGLKQYVATLKYIMDEML